MEHENETTALTSLITDQHVTIGDQFVRRVMGMIKTAPVSIKKYAVEESYGSDIESIAIKLSDRSTLNIQLYTSRS